MSVDDGRGEAGNKTKMWISVKERPFCRLGRQGSLSTRRNKWFEDCVKNCQGGDVLRTVDFGIFGRVRLAFASHGILRLQPAVLSYYTARRKNILHLLITPLSTSDLLRKKIADI